MALLIAFAFVAGVGTALSPCVLPVLPVALSAGATGGARRPLGIVAGLALSFTFATVALVYLIHALGLPNGVLRTLAIIALIAFGAALLLPPVAARVEAWLSGLAGRTEAGTAAGRDRGREGFWSGLLVGASLGLVYAPCAGPILAGVITVSASQTFTAGRLAVALAYGLGSAVTLFLLALAGRRLTRRLPGRSVRPQMAAGAGVVLVDFWTYSCINCIRTLPYLRAWDARYRSQGLTIVGIHTPEFPFERDAGNVAAAIRSDGLHYPVAQDNEEGTWNAYGNQYWP